MTARKLFVTTALPYANGPFHIGHIMEYIQADIWVRFQRMQGHEVHFVCADDAHGAPIMLKAEAEGITPQELVARVGAERPKYLHGFHLSFDNWHSTDSPENIELSQDIYRRLSAAGLIYRKPVEQFYDPVKGMFLADRYIKGECPKCHSKDQYGDACEVCSSVYAPTDLINPYSTLTGATPVLKTSEHYFFRLSDPRCVAFLNDWTATPGRLQPQVLNKAREWLEGKGERTLGDWDISRDAPYFGFEIPGAPGKYFYVWVDAPIGYLSSFRDYCTAWNAKHPEKTIRFEDFVERADAQISRTEMVHFIGKDIIYFHTLFWPAMLHGAGLRTPTAVHVHGFMTVDGAKMSKSRGTFINARTYLDHLDPDYLRYYLATLLGPTVPSIRDVPWVGLFRDTTFLPTLGRILPAFESAASLRHVVTPAVDALERAGSLETLLRYVVGRPLEMATQRRFALADVPSDLRLALEMSAHEETERRALEGELKLLEREWRAAEAVAAIADELSWQHR